MALVPEDFKRLVKYVYKQEKISKAKKAKATSKEKPDGEERGFVIRGKVHQRIHRRDSRAIELESRD